MPAGYDAVVQVEDTEKVQEGERLGGDGSRLNKVHPLSRCRFKEEATHHQRKGSRS